MRHSRLGFLALGLLLACSDVGSSRPIDRDNGPRADVSGDTDPDLVDTEDVDPGSLTLLSDGLSHHQIVVQDGASPSEQLAAEELQTHFEACTGQRLPIISAAEATDVPMIVLGRGPIARALGVDPPDVALGDQGFAIETVGDHLVIAGTAQAGTLYGVHRFLEDALGVRWLAPGVTLTPAVDELALPATQRLEQPAFFWRNTSYEWPGADADFRSRVGLNNGSGGIEHRHGVQYDSGGAAHTYLDFLHPDEHFDEHPEYFSEIGGVRVREETQLCLTNPDVLEIVTERLLAQMAADPDARQHTFSQEDYYNQCTCEHCAAMNALYETQGGTQFWFANRLAERTSVVHPDKLIRTLAYMYTEEPPVGLTMHPNVAVWLCHMYPSCDSHPIASCPHNADYYRRAETWSELAEHLYVWHYVTNFTHYYNPFPNFRALAADLRSYRDLGVEGIYLQGMGHDGGGGEWSLLRPYYGVRLLWDPDQDPDALIDEFLSGYYGAAAPALHAYVDRLHDEVTDRDIHMHLYTNPSQGYLSDALVEQAETWFDEAEAAVADDPERLERVRVARMPLVYTRFFPRNGYDIGDDRLRWRGQRASFQEVVDFVDRMRRHGFGAVREWEGEPDTMLLLSTIVGQDLELVVLENAVLRVEIVPMLGGRALRIVDRQSGQSVTAHDTTRNLYYPFAGGLEDRIGGLFRYFGWVEPARITARTETSVTLVSDTFNGFRLERTLSLDPNEPVLVAESVVTNTGNQPAPAQLRAHLSLDLGDLESTRVRFESRDGEAVDRDMTGLIETLRVGQPFFRDRTPNGAWTFTGSKGLELTQRFDPDGVSHTTLVAYPADNGELEAELWAPRSQLSPGESVSLRHEIEVR